MAKRPTEKQCMDYADKCLAEEKSKYYTIQPGDVERFVEAKKRTGNGRQAVLDMGITTHPKTADTIAAKLKKECELRGIEQDTQTEAQLRLVYGLVKMVREWEKLKGKSWEMDDLRMVGKCNEEIGKLLGLYKTITENTNHNDYPPEVVEILKNIQARHGRSGNNQD